MGLSIILLCATILQTFFQYGKCNASSSECSPVPNMACAWQDGNGSIYNLAPLIYSSNERIHRGFVVNGTPHGKYSQYYSYSYNPCSWLSLAGDCEREFETAICKWTPNNHNPDNYQSIGNKLPKCTKTNNGIHLTYNAGGRYLEGKKSIVHVKCDRTKVDIKDAIFKVFSEDEWKFGLSHLCGCGNGCRSETSLTSSAAKENSYIAVEIAVPTAGGLLLICLAVTIWWKWGNNRRDDERRPLRQDGPRQEGADIIRDVPHGPDFERRQAPVAPSRKKDNNLRRVSI